MSDGNKKMAHTYTNLQVCFKYMWSFCYHQELKGLKYLGTKGLIDINNSWYSNRW